MHYALSTKVLPVIEDTVFYCLCLLLLCVSVHRHTYIHHLQVAIMTPEGRSGGYPYIQISPYR